MACALAALMRGGSLTPARHRLECLRPIVKATVDEARRFLLANFVKTYIELEGEDAEEYRALLAEETNQEVATMELTWADKIEARGVERGLEQGRQQGEAALLLRQMARKFGPLDAKTRREIDNADPQQLLEWGERFVTAQSTEEVFNGSR